jgi:hypothetical protein
VRTRVAPGREVAIAGGLVAIGGALVAIGARLVAIGACLIGIRQVLVVAGELLRGRRAVGTAVGARHGRGLHEVSLVEKHVSGTARARVWRATLRSLQVAGLAIR